MELVMWWLGPMPGSRGLPGTRIEGLALEAPDKPAGLDIRYAVQCQCAARQRQDGRKAR
jgi:hypothetical protein